MLVKVLKLCLLHDNLYEKAIRALMAREIQKTVFYGKAILFSKEEVIFYTMYDEKSKVHLELLKRNQFPDRFLSWALTFPTTSTYET